MLIDQIFPAVVAQKDRLRNILFSKVVARGLTDESANEIVTSIPQSLISAGAFLDKMTSLWRYEFGLPYDIADELVWGTHMWVPVDQLVTALLTAHARLKDDKLSAYLKRLADPQAHQITLVEMVPADKVPLQVSMDFEVAGLGKGKRTVDWVIGPYNERTVLLDVKRRAADFINQARKMKTDGQESVPNHDPALLFRSVEQKYVTSDPSDQLQGVWIFTDIKQERRELIGAFEALDESKVHFAILGDWKQDAYVIVRRDIDRQYLNRLFKIEPSERFTFDKI